MPCAAYVPVVQEEQHCPQEIHYKAVQLPAEGQRQHQESATLGTDHGRLALDEAESQPAQEMGEVDSNGRHGDEVCQKEDSEAQYETV